MIREEGGSTREFEKNLEDRLSDTVLGNWSSWWSFDQFRLGAHFWRAGSDWHIHRQRDGQQSYRVGQSIVHAHRGCPSMIRNEPLRLEPEVKSIEPTLAQQLANTLLSGQTKQCQGSCTFSKTKSVPDESAKKRSIRSNRLND